MDGNSRHQSPASYEALKLSQGAAYNRYDDEEVNASHRYLLPAVLSVLEASVHGGAPKRLLDLGCGSGGATAQLFNRGFDVTGVDASWRGIEIAKSKYPNLKFFQASCYDDLSSRFGRFPFVISMEVIEHLYWPRLLLKCAYNLLEPGGRLILTTPYHGYLKNLALALTGKMESHFDTKTDDGHIKFFSVKTLRELVMEAGFEKVDFDYVGRVPVFAKSMLVTAVR